MRHGLGIVSFGIFVLLGFGDPSVHASRAPCVNGKAAGFPCLNVDLMSRLDLTKSGTPSRTGNDIWGWTDPNTMHEYAIMGLSAKTSFVDVTDAENPVHVGDLPGRASSSIWRDVKVYQNFAFVVSEAFGHNLQVFDLTELRDFDAAKERPRVFHESKIYKLFSSAHNIFINEDTGYAYVVGSNTCSEAVHVIDVRNPTDPKFVTCIDEKVFSPYPGTPRIADAGGNTYTHDIHCVVYNGPDAQYQGHEICVASNADTVNIVDVTNKSAPKELSLITYRGVGYVHQGWLTEDHRYFVLGDELDEQKSGEVTKTYFFDVSDLKHPQLVQTYRSTSHAIDHNLYIKGDHVFQANYLAGLRVLKMNDVATGKISEVAYFDTEPGSDKAEFEGAWSVYPWFASGNIILSNLDGALFVLRPNLP